ncbi:DUF2268 domain-containing putative Zn-dependent protease [Lutibacter sp. B1]|uniref:DUF2268 domain-containing putative Zn-dependent protease n=1 Tax=Lutibacter sp. B1 TaxID=2725996 RepID=UPI00145731FC|nr:DUF2268 domain-containing putative Zn-dependent protease [Lutibacter sp. B1]NLP59363.1 DUF2268 domain-containing protein [Lutibacter sp. B1]
MDRKVIYFLFLSFFLQVNVSAQNEQMSGVEIIDISQKQIELMNMLQNEPVEKRNAILIDSIYKPNSYLWKGYLGSESDFANWVNNTAYKELESYNTKANSIDLSKLNQYFFETVREMEKFTGNKPKGKWYIFFGPKWTNLGGFDDGTMLIDLAHESNKSLEDIKIFFPHEINHQIYSDTMEQENNAVLYRILDEGFACYVSYLFHGGKTTIAEELDFTEPEYKACLENEKELIKLLKKNYKSNNEKLSDNFANRGYRFSEKLPGAVGYYIGFRIVDEFVKRNGKDSWKKIYEMSPRKVLRKSKILK